MPSTARALLVAFAGGAGGGAVACSSSPTDPAAPSPPPAVTPTPTPTLAPTATPTTQPTQGPGPFDIAITGITADELATFRNGDALFDTTLRDADGLGPLYTRAACNGCHTSGVRGPGSVQKMSVVLQDGFTPSTDQSALPFGNTVHPLLAGGGKTAVLPPADLTNVKVTSRVGPSILGRGYMEAVLDSEIERVAQSQAVRTDAIHGRINHVVFTSVANPDTRFHTHQQGDVIIGRFGFKARIGTLDDFTADALQGDMGITSPMRPVEIVNPDGLTDDLKPGLDVAIASVNARANYVRLTAIPDRAITAAGTAVFVATKCSVCHVPSLQTRADYPIAVLASIAAPLYSDLLLHDMGAQLADGIQDGEARSQDWRTPPLIGLRFVKTYLHDSRATTLDEAILMHDGTGSEAAESVGLYRALSTVDQATLLAFVGAL